MREDDLNEYLRRQQSLGAMMTRIGRHLDCNTLLPLVEIRSIPIRLLFHVTGSLGLCVCGLLNGFVSRYSAGGLGYGSDSRGTRKLMILLGFLVGQGSR